MYHFHGEGSFRKDVVIGYGMAGGGDSCGGSLFGRICQGWSGANKEGMNITSNSIQESVQIFVMESDVVW